MSKQSRDNAYYLRRLADEHPAVHADLLSGKHSTVAEALVAAGLKKPRSRLQELKNAWSKASPVERDQFLRSIGATTGSGRAVLTTAARGSPAGRIVAFDAQNRLAPGARTRIVEIMDRRRLSQSDVMDQLGHKRLNIALWMAIQRNTVVRQGTLRAAVQDWLNRNAGV